MVASSSAEYFNHQEAVAYAWKGLMDTIDLRTIQARGAVALFDGFKTAAIAAAVIAGALALALLFYTCWTTVGLGAHAWRGHTVYEGTELRTIWCNTPTGKRQMTVSRPKFREERRRSKTSWIHLIAIVGYWSIILFGVYSAFQVCGVDPALLIALGAGTLLFSYGLAPLISETRDAIRVFWGNRLHENDDILVWAVHIKGRVRWMGSNYFEMEEIDADGNLIEHQLGYSTLLAPGFSRWVTGGAQHVMGKAWKDHVELQAQQPQPHGRTVPVSSPDRATEEVGSYIGRVFGKKNL